MNADSYYEQGFGHTVCQDYAAHGETDNFFYAVVCDGCSTSPFTDVGARILAHAFINGLERYVRTNRDLGHALFEDKSMPDFGKMMQMQALYSLSPIQQHTGLEDRAFNSTLVAVVYSKLNQKAYSFVWGDGLVYLRYGSWHLLHQFSYETNAPYYFAYFACGTEKQYQQEFGDNKATVINLRGNLNDNLGWEEIDREKAEPFYFAEIPTLDLNLVLVSSDGLETYGDEQDAPIDYKTVLGEVSSYKGYAGNFIQRRMTRLKREHKKTNTQHFDDIGIAGISFV